MYMCVSISIDQIRSDQSLVLVRVGRERRENKTKQNKKKKKKGEGERERVIAPSKKGRKESSDL